MPSPDEAEKMRADAQAMRERTMNARKYPPFGGSVTEGAVQASPLPLSPNEAAIERYPRMVNGPRMIVQADELRRHCNATADKYAKRHLELLPTVAKLKGEYEAMAAAEEARLMQQPGYQETVDRGEVFVASAPLNGKYSEYMRAARDADDCEDHAAGFRFMASHLFDAPYCLTPQEARRLDLIRGPMAGH